jgi:hypothetical protein
MNSSNSSFEKAKIYLDLAQKTDATIQLANQRLNEKIRNIFTLASALIPTVAGLGYFIAKETSSYWILFPIFLSISAFISAIALGIMLFTGSSYLYVDPKTTFDKYQDKNKSARFYVNIWASTYCDTANQNASVVNAKLTRINYMNKCIIIGLAIFGFSFLLLAISLSGIIPQLLQYFQPH